MKVGLGLGSNLGDRLANLRAAAESLRKLSDDGRMLASSVYESEPDNCPPGSPSFYNAVVELETSRPALDFLEACQAIESRMGRPAVREQNAPRIIDIDILYFGTEEISEKTLTVPHPRMNERPFVLLPLREIRPDHLLWNLEPGAEDTGCKRITGLLESDSPT